MNVFSSRTWKKLAFNTILSPSRFVSAGQELFYADRLAKWPAICRGVHYFLAFASVMTCEYHKSTYYTGFYCYRESKTCFEMFLINIFVIKKVYKYKYWKAA